MLDQVDVDRLTAILTGKAAPPEHDRQVYCSECGFQNPEAANYCSRCGALLQKGEPPVETTQTLSPEEVGELADAPRSSGLEGPALVVRAGGGRAGESFRPAGERTRIGRSPDCEIFLDDVTVSRNHAVLVEERRRVLRRGPGLAERHLRQPQAHRQRAARERRRAADRQVPDDVHRMTIDAPRSQRERLLRIGEVVRRLARSSRTSRSRRSATSRTRGCSTPRRTQGGYRLFSEADLERLQTILRLQRDEFLPLRVIKDELDAPGREGAQAPPADALGADEETITFDELCERAGVSPELREGARGLRAARAARQRRATSAIRSPTPTSPRRARS